MKNNIFLSHANLDRNDYVIPFSEGLSKEGITYWLDEAEIKWGDKIGLKINQGLDQSDFVVVFLTENFIGRNWTETELSAALCRENDEGRVVVLPIVVGDPKCVLSHYPLLRDKSYRLWDNGLDALIGEIKSLLPIKGSSISIPAETKSISSIHDNLQWEISQEEKLGHISGASKQPNGGALNSVLMFGSDNNWSGDASKEGYCLTNLNNTRAVKYFYIGVNKAKEQVSIDIKLEPSSNTNVYSCGGLLFRFDKKTKYYYTFTLHSDNTVALHKRNDSGFEQLFREEVNFLEKGKSITLGVHAINDKLSLYVKNRLFRVFMDDELKKGYTGIVAMGTGTFYFENYSLFKFKN